MTFMRQDFGLAIRPALRIWLPVAAAATVVSGLVYVAVQQDIRLSANDPQQQMAEDAAASLNAGAQPSDVIPPGKVDVRSSLAPFVMVYDTSGNLLASSGVQDGGPPTYPTSAFADARNMSVDRITWDTRDGIRDASVIVPYHGGFVVAARSLRPAEDRIDRILQLVIACWVLALGGSALAALVGVILLPPPTRAPTTAG